MYHFHLLLVIFGETLNIYSFSLFFFFLIKENVICLFIKYNHLWFVTKSEKEKERKEEKLFEVLAFWYFGFAMKWKKENAKGKRKTTKSF